MSIREEEERGNGNTWIMDSRAMSILKQLKQASHEQDTSSADVQILEHLAGECKNQLVAISQAGLGKLQLRQDEQDREASQKAARVFACGLGCNSQPNH